jgi:hypothetical protein
MDSGYSVRIVSFSRFSSPETNPHLGDPFGHPLRAIFEVRINQVYWRICSILLRLVLSF